MKTISIHRLELNVIAIMRCRFVAASIAVGLGILHAQAQFKLNIGVTPNERSVVLRWTEPNVELEVASDVSGPYSTIQGAASPYVWRIVGTSFFRLRQTGGGVHGSLYVQIGTDPPSQQIFLPDIKVYLRNTATAADSAPVVTDYFGRYAFPTQPAGRYVLRWDAQLGWAAGQHPDPIAIGNGTQYPVPARILADQTNGVIYGRVAFADGDTPWFYDELFAEKHTATVTVLNAARTVILAGPIHANVGGWYAAAGPLPRSVNLSARAQTEAATTTRVVPAANVSFGNTVATTDMQLPNHKPELLTVVRQVGGVAVATAPGGTAIQLDALTRDLDGDPLTYNWRALPGQGSLAPTSGSSVQWTLPPEAGNHSVYLQVEDGRGGYARHRVDFFVDQVDTVFSGRVVNRMTGAPIGGASVSVNGTNTTTTAANGFYLVRAPLARRYVFNITRPGYALFSRVVYDGGESGQTWRLVPAQASVVDPTQPIVLVDERPQRTNGVTVRVPAGALVDASGNPPSGPLTAYLATYDVASGGVPGDWGALSGVGEVNLISYGAGFVEFVDAAENKYNLAPGMMGQVIVPAPATLLAGAPAAMPMWSYDEADGYWKESGNAVFNPGTGNYSGIVTRFSAFNTDLALTDAACLKVLLYPPLPTGVRLKMSDPTGVNFAQTFEFVLDRPLRGIYRVPANIDVKLELEDPTGIAYGNLIIEEVPGTPLAGNVVNSGPPIPAGETWWPDEPYDTCKLVILRLGTPEQSVFLTFKGEGTDPQAAGYYSGVDPTGARDTLGEWWTANGFTLGGDGWPLDATSGDSATIRTSYLNNNDLGSGRDMYFRDLGSGHLAAFVVNYGLFNQDAGNADLAVARTAPGATVCMEYSPVEGQGSTPIVKFFVFKGADGKANAPQVRSANLDGFGEKYVPNLCLNCHGGSYFPADPSSPTFAEINMGARFRELDYATYKFPAGALVPNATERTAFKAQNLLIANAGSTCASQGIRDLIAGWYSSGSTAQDNNYTPPNWDTPTVPAQARQLYHDMVKNSCRTCHVALDDSVNASGLNWTRYDQLKARQGFLESFVLCDGRVMPHAVITYRNFWLSGSPHQPGELRAYSDGADWPAFGDCP